MKIYIAGKIAGDRRYRAKFREAAKTLEAAGHVVLNPATLPDGLTDGDYMRIALAMLEASDLAVFLPDYQESRGAMVEWAVLLLSMLAEKMSAPVPPEGGADGEQKN